METKTTVVNTGIKPKVSIGLPVYNGENYLEDALKSLLSQSFSNFELIISDNASTDKTQQICRNYAALDDRIRYYRAKKNQGAAPNFNHVVRRAKGEYFKWAAHDDLCSSEYLENCVTVLDQKKDVILCHTLSYAIDETGKKLGVYHRDTGFDGGTAAQRLDTLINKRHLCVVIFGLIRIDLLRKTPLLQAYVGSDRNLLAELGLMGKIHVVDKPLFSRRDHQQTSVKRFSGNDEGWITWFNPNKKVDLHLPTLKTALEYQKSIVRVGLEEKDHKDCIRVLQQWKESGVDYRGRPVKKLMVEELRKKSQFVPKASIEQG